MTQFVSALAIPDERALLQELNHRISNEFFSAMNLVSLAAARSGSEEVKAVLNGVTELLHNYAELHQVMQFPHGEPSIDAAAYLHKLNLSIKRSKLDHMRIELVLSAPPALMLHSEDCWLLGMIVYELITNAARHAFAGRNGEIRVELLRVGDFVGCKVRDNGRAPANTRPGVGLKIIAELVKALNGEFEQTFRKTGSLSMLIFPRRPTLDRVPMGRCN
jgi:two-component sensor histidine kinase